MNLYHDKSVNWIRGAVLSMMIGVSGPVALGQELDPSQQNQAAKRLAVTEYLVRQGVPETEAQARVAHLNDSEIQEMDLALEKERAGQDSTVTLGVGTAVLIGLILFIL
ncbi:MAG: PA2779 family protein [Oligoflexus sp.]